ncbi:hypothetical protein [Thermococcus chitonophagus]|nr:hypothetical protein [Thermococcus chitonophagus]CUX78438.1 hypothetical protein CHITON_1659 [Thermococcus chitonophagus]
MEIWVSEEDIELIKANKEKIEQILRSEDKLRELLLSLKFKFLKERQSALENRLSRVSTEYERLVKFYVQAENDKMKMMELRLKLHRENERLRRQLNESRLQSK